jgi:putative ABC transport system ATP-binding protein
MRRTDTPVLEMHGVSMVHRTAVVETHALRDVDLRIDEGEFVSVLGPSGSGKSSLLSVAGLLEAPTSGLFGFCGDDVRGLGDAARGALRCRAIGFVFQGFHLIPDIDIHNNVELPLRLQGIGTAERRRRTREALGRVGLEGRAHHFPAQLSGGQQQRAAIARAIVGRPRLVLADEPTGNLDSRMAEGVMDLLAELNASGSTVLVVTHDSAVAARTGRSLRMLDGTLVELHGAADAGLRRAGWGR